MSLTLPLVRPRVLLTHPGPRVAETVHALLAQQARVTVARPEPGPGTGGEDPDPDGVHAVLSDLAGRGLVELLPAGAEAAGAEAAGAARYDVVLADPGRSGPPVPAPPDRPAATGRVVLVGGGPGDPGLLTVRGLAAVREADVVVCDRLAPLAVLEQARPGVEVVHVGKIPRGRATAQEQIDALLVERARRGLTVVRLKGGDGFVLGRGGEEWNACVRAGVPVEVVPGVSSAVAVPGLAGLPVTHRAVSQGFVVVSGHVGPASEADRVDWAALARCGLTLVVLMGVATLAEIAETLVRHGMDPATPAACVADGSLPTQRQVRAPLSRLAAAAAAADPPIGPPAVTVIGPVVTALEVPRP